MVRFDLGPLAHGQMRIAKLKSAYNSLIIGPRGLGWQTNPWEIMVWESSGVVRFDLRPLVQGQRGLPNLKVLIIRLLLVVVVRNVKPTHRKSCAVNLLAWTDLTLGPSFKVK